MIDAQDKSSVETQNNDSQNNEKSSSDSLIREKLIAFRKAKSKEKNVPAYYIFTNDELEKLLELMPKTKAELESTKILTDIKVRLHGDEIIEILNL